MSTPQPRKRTVATLVRQIEAAQKRIANERDKLRSLCDDAEGILDTCEEADQGLQQAVDALSRYV